MYDHMESATARLRSQGERIRGLQEQLAQRSTTVASKDRMVAVTVGGTGRLTALTFKGNRHRTMAPAELASVVMQTVNAALEEATAAAMGAAQALLPAGMDAASLAFDSRIDLEEFMRSTIEKVDSSLSRWQTQPRRDGE